MQNLRDTILIRLRAGRLDADLADGYAPEQSRWHAARARELVAPHRRHVLAASWERLLATAGDRTRARSNRLPIRRDQVRRAEPEIRELIAALRAVGPMPVRGVAIASALLTDGCGPIYNRFARDDLAAVVALAAEHLDPALPLTRDHFVAGIGAPSARRRV